MYEFYPDGYIPDEKFSRRAELLRRRNYLLLWIENPDDDFESWRWYGCNCPGCISLGRYRLFLSSCEHSDTSELKFKGTFMCGDFAFDTSEIVLSLSNGQFNFSISSSQGTDVFEALGAGIRYIIPADPDSEIQGKAKKSAAFISNSLLRYKGNGAFNVSLSLNCLWDPAKTCITLPKEQFESNMTDRMGNIYIMEPLRDSALVFERSALSVFFDKKSNRQTTSQHGFYLGFSGSFRIIDSSEILLGLYGMEYIRSCNEIGFCSGHSAFLGSEFPNYSNCATTAWITPFNGEYFSMPESMPLYAMKNSVLQTYETPAAEFSQSAAPVPFFPWKNAHISDNMNVDTADDILYRQRRDILCGKIKEAQLCVSNADSEVTAVTPAGMCVGIEGTVWKWLGIAQTSQQPLPNVRINGITPEAKEQLLQKDCFIVISSREEYLKFGSGSITIETDGWKITLSEESWNDSLLIIKYCTGASVKDKLSDNSTFKRLMESAYIKSAQKESYEGFINAVSSERFEGVMLLNVCAYADESKLSPETLAVVAMTGQKYLNCVYAAVKRSRVDVIDGQVNVSASQTDALIIYESEGINQSSDDCDYTCKTVGLKAVIKNSRTESFTSRTEILPKSLMGEALSNPQSLALIGGADIQNGVTVYRFTLERQVDYVPVSKPVETISINNVSMSSDHLQSRFLLGGAVSMTYCSECDIFSYDSLGFEGVQIVCDGENAYEDLSALRIRSDNIKVRTGSAAEVFGAEVSEYIMKSSAKSPDELGFSSITAPVRQSEISSGWNGIIHHIAIGNSGSLGGDLPLYFEFITAWKDGGYYFGVRMKDVFSKQFSLQGLLNVGFQSIALINSSDNTPMFKLNSLTVKMLGLSVPPKSADLYIFGKSGMAGWYFGYSEE